MITVARPLTPDAAVPTYRLVPDAWAAALTPEGATTLDATLLALTIADAYQFVAELAVFQPLLPARLLASFLAVDLGQDIRHPFNQLIAAWNRTRVQ
jgi:hypothetical protein